jgi:DNA repair protein RadC
MTIKLTAAQQRTRIANGADLFQVMRAILKRDAKLDRRKEHFWVAGLADNDLLLYVELISLGGRKATVVEPMDIFRWALQKDSARIILVHNHPRGTLQPTAPDVELTAHLYQVGELLELPVVDHLIITETAYHSFLDSGLMAEIAHSRKYLLSAAAQERLKAEADKAGEARGLKAGRQEGEVKGREAVALAMKTKGIAASDIAEVTGLSVAKVKGLKAAAEPRRGTGPKAKTGR